MATLTENFSHELSLLLPAAPSNIIKGLECEERAFLEDRCMQSWGKQVRFFLEECQTLIEEQLFTLISREPSIRKNIELQFFKSVRELGAFYWYKFSSTLVESVVLTHRGGAAIIWLSEALQRGEIRSRRKMIAEEISQRDLLGRVIFLELQRAWDDESPARQRLRINHLPQSFAQRFQKRQEKLAELYAERARGVAAAMLENFHTVYEAATVRLSWAEARERKKILHEFVPITNQEMYISLEETLSPPAKMLDSK